MGLCPYCNHEIHITDFFKDLKVSRNKDGTISQTYGRFTGEWIESAYMVGGGYSEIKMFVCPACQKILSFCDSCKG